MTQFQLPKFNAPPTGPVNSLQTDEDNIILSALTYCPVEYEAATCSPTGSAVGIAVELAVQSDEDDGWFYLDTCTGEPQLYSGIFVDGSGLQQCYFGGSTSFISGVYAAESMEAFVKFSSSIPQGSVINKAYLRINKNYAGGYGGSGTVVNAKIDAIYDPESYTITQSPEFTDVYSATRTTARVNWDNIPDDWNENHIYGAHGEDPRDWTESPDISCVIQEIVDHEDYNPATWTFMIFIRNNASDEGTRSFPSYGNSTIDPGGTYETTGPEMATRLFIWYSNNYEHNATGGVLVGGSADGLGSGGVLVGGDSSSRMYFYHTATDGVLIGGSGFLGFQETATDGVLVGGAATDGLSYNHTATSGVVVHGTRWLYKKILTIPAGSTTESITKFYLPVAVYLGETKGSANVLFTNSSGVDLVHEVREWNSTTGRLFAVVKIPIPTTETYIVLYYGEN